MTRIAPSLLIGGMETGCIHDSRACGSCFGSGFAHALSRRRRGPFGCCTALLFTSVLGSVPAPLTPVIFQVQESANEVGG